MSFGTDESVLFIEVYLIQRLLSIYTNVAFWTDIKGHVYRGVLNSGVSL